jgi:hypothetical protein
MLNEIGKVLLSIILAFSVIYGMFWIGKNLSYTFFYRSLVESTVTEMVKPEYLIKVK